MEDFLYGIIGFVCLPLLVLTIVFIAKSHKPATKTLSIVSCVMASMLLIFCTGMAVSVENQETTKEPEKKLSFLDDFTEYGYSEKQIEDMRTVLTNVGITEITDLEIQPVVAGMQVVKGLAYKDTSFLADSNDEVQVTFCIENGVIYLVAIYCPSYHTDNKPTYLSGLTDRRADLYYDVEGGYLKKIDWKNKAVVDYD